MEAVNFVVAAALVALTAVLVMRLLAVADHYLDEHEPRPAEPQAVPAPQPATVALRPATARRTPLAAPRGPRRPVPVMARTLTPAAGPAARLR